MTDNLAQNGLLVTVSLCYKINFIDLWASYDLPAVIDTGSLHTLLQEGVATSLGLTPVDTISLPTVRGRMLELYRYDIWLQFPGSDILPVRIIELPHKLHTDTTIKCKIGRDILQHGVLTYDGTTDTFSLNF
jgi:hypothetical protein